jgi:SAM-dependent methyltransferase
MRPTSVAPSPWDRFSVGYTDKVFSPLQFAHVRRRIVEAVRPPCVLDMGCGPTPFLLRDLLELPDVELFASDLSQKMLDEAARHFPPGAIRFVPGDNRCLPFPDNFFDTVIAVNSILPENRDEVEHMFAQVRRVLRPGGRFVALLPAFETSLMARDHWRMAIRVDEKNHREYDTLGWQCFYTRQDVADLATRHEFARAEVAPVYFDSEEEVEAIRKIYGRDLSPQILREFPLFEHLLVADKAGHSSRW